MPASRRCHSQVPSSPWLGVHCWDQIPPYSPWWIPWIDLSRCAGLVACAQGPSLAQHISWSSVWKLQHRARLKPLRTQVKCSLFEACQSSSPKWYSRKWCLQWLPHRIRASLGRGSLTSSGEADREPAYSAAGSSDARSHSPSEAQIHCDRHSTSDW